MSDCAGMQATGPIVEQPIEHFQMVQDTNCTGPVRMIQAFAPAMIKQACMLLCYDRLSHLLTLQIWAHILLILEVGCQARRKCAVEVALL